MCLLTFLRQIAALMACVALSGCSSQRKVVTVPVVVPTPTLSLSNRPPFKPVSLSGIPIYAQNGEVIIDLAHSTGNYGDSHAPNDDPNFTFWGMAATVLWNDKNSQIFEIREADASMSSRSSSIMRYNRSKKLLVSENMSAMSGKLLQHSRVTCRHLTDAIIYKLATTPRLALEKAGCTCTTTDFLKTRKHR